MTFICFNFFMLVNVLPPSALYQRDCVGRERTVVHVINTLCDTCQSQGCSVKKEKKILSISFISSSPQSLPHSLHLSIVL